MSGAPDFQVQDPKGARETAIARFYMEARRNNARSEADGQPRFDDVEMVEILIPGDRNAVSVQFVKPEHKQRFAREYAAFKANQEAPADGTPIAELPGIMRSQVEELTFQHIRTVETLAILPDDKAMKAITMGGMALRDRARRYLESTAGAAAEEKLAAENRAKDERIAQLEGQLADLTKRIDQIAAKRPEPEA